jgi:hypothetical protein
LPRPVEWEAPEAITCSSSALPRRKFIHSLKNLMQTPQDAKPANAFLATNIAFIKEVGADVQEIARGMVLDNGIGTNSLHPGRRAGYPDHLPDDCSSHFAMMTIAGRGGCSFMTKPARRPYTSTTFFGATAVGAVNITLFFRWIEILHLHKFSLKR